jgi:hypothetical protein
MTVAQRELGRKKVTVTFVCPGKNLIAVTIKAGSRTAKSTNII